VRSPHRAANLLLSRFASTGALSMSAVLRVQVPPKGDHLNRSEPQLRKGDRSWGGSGERNRGPMNKKRIRGGAGRGERDGRREAPMVNSPGDVYPTAMRGRTAFLPEEISPHA